jgi:hypothetical protein
MIVKDLKDLQKIIQLCRKTGVESIKIDNVEFHLGALPKATKRNKNIDLEAFPESNIKIPQFTPVTTEETSTTDVIATDELTDEQLLMWSAQDSSNQPPGQ